MEKEAFLKKFRMNKRFPFKQDQGIEFGCPFKEGFLKVGCLANVGPSGLGVLMDPVIISPEGAKYTSYGCRP